MKLKKLIPGLLILTFFSCDKFDYSHYQITANEHRNLNQNNISKFINTVSDTLTIAIIGDSQRFYDDTGKIISKINNIPKIDFVVHTGDLVDFGTQEEYLWIHEQLTGLIYPYVAVVGNHDMIGNGGEIYNSMYGDYNFSFTVNGNKFIYLNTNSREFNFSNNVPDIDWLNNELSDTSNYNNAIIICHVSHLHEDFNSELVNDFKNVLRKYKKVLLSINGHNHNFGYIAPDADNIAYLNTYSTSKGKFVLVKIWDSSFSYEIIN